MCASSPIFVRSSTFGVPSQRLWIWLAKAMGHHGCFSAASPESRECGSWWESHKAIRFSFWQPMALWERGRNCWLLDNQACFFNIDCRRTGSQGSLHFLSATLWHTDTHWVREGKRAFLLLHKSSGGLEINLGLSSLYVCTPPPSFFPLPSAFFVFTFLFLSLSNCFSLSFCNLFLYICLFFFSSFALLLSIPLSASPSSLSTVFRHFRHK